MELREIEKVKGLDKKTFVNEFLIPKKPVIFEDLIKDWPAKDKWSFDWFKQNHGSVKVPVIDKHYHDPDKYFQVAKTMDLADYLDIIKAGPTDYRIFLFDIFKKVPELANDIRYPKIMDGFIKSYKFMFFGGEGAVTNLHYDMDCSNVFLTHFETRKKLILFAPDQSKLLYHHPFTVMSHFDPEKPDYEKYPAAEKLSGFEGVINHGETAFIPSLWWHHIRYIDGGFSLALRANDSIFTTLKGGYNLAQHAIIDRGLTSIFGANWKEWKEKTAAKRALEAVS